MDRRHVRRGAVSAAAAVALLAAACTDDDDGSAFTDQLERTTTSESSQGGGDDPGGGADAYCTAETALEVAPAPDSSDSEAVAEWAGTTAKPMLEEVVAAAPEELDSDLSVIAQALDELIATGDTAALSDPGYLEAAGRIHEYDLANCGWTQVDITAREYAFEGIPDEVTAGVASFELSNDGEELHEVRVFRLADGTSLSDDEVVELFAGPEDAWAGIVEPVGTGEYTAQGDSGYFVAELAPGTYYAVCFIPVGATSEEVPPPSDAALHLQEGMLTEFTAA